MPKKQPDVPKRLRLGKNKKSPDRKPPGTVGGGGGIRTNLPEIEWTPSKLTITIAVLIVPYLIAVIVSLYVRNYLIAGVFVGIGLLVIGLYFLLRYLERSDF